ncbi:MAG TPA: M15 family metallopeptidase [Polyangia bacterium]
MPRGKRHVRARGMALSLWMAVLGTLWLACASGGATRPTPAPAPAESPTTARPVEEPAPVEAPTPAPPAAPPKPAPQRLAWVNPARCLATCALDPTPSLTRVDDLGVPAPTGKHLVETNAQTALQALIAAGKADGHELAVRSAFRSYDEQAEVFRTTKQLGRAARPGHSEHQLGTAIDVALPNKAAIAWLAAAAPRFGFVISYPAGKQRITGYRPEPWHIRHVGEAIAREIANTPGATLEELLRARPELGDSGDCGDCPASASRAPVCKLPEGVEEDPGRCRKNVLTWCYAGVRTAVDCAAFGQVCKRDANDRFDCQDPPADAAATTARPSRKRRTP